MAATSSLLLLALLLSVVHAHAHAHAAGFRLGFPPKILLPSDEEGGDEKPAAGTTWALLVAGSKGYSNYRHQSDVCHAYQILKKGGIKEENIVVFMYDDIANNPQNPRPGIIINHPNGTDVYAGVPKDYTGGDVTAKNVLAVLLGDRSAVSGGSGKVIDSQPEDQIFVYYTDHGSPGMLGMPNEGEYLYANDLIEALKKKHAMGTYKEMVLYVEACESGSIFEGLLPDNLRIYVMTASNARESSWAAYCPGMDPPPPTEFITCLGDLYSVSWMEDSEVHNLKMETIGKQYETVKERTSGNNTFLPGSHVMEYGTMSIKQKKLYHFQGFDPANAHAGDGNGLGRVAEPVNGLINQRDADLYPLWQRYKHLEDTSEEKALLIREIAEKAQHRVHVDTSVELIGRFLFGPQNGPSILKAVRPAGSALVDDWACLKYMVGEFEAHCGHLREYGMKHTRAFANICNEGVSRRAVRRACASVCGIRTRV